MLTLISLLVISASLASDLDQDIIACYDMNSSTTADDYSGKMNLDADGTGHVLVDGHIGTAVLLNGNGWFGNVTTVIVPAGNVTITMWVNLSVKDTSGSMFMSYGAYTQFDQFRWGIDSGNDFEIPLHSNDWLDIILGYGTNHADEWKHLIFTHDASTNTENLYVDGRLNATRVAANELTIATTHLYIGKFSENSDYNLDGEVDVTVIWNKTITDDGCLNGSLCGGDVATLWNSGAGRACNDLAAPPADTCTAPGSGDWIVDCADDCQWTTAQDVPANMQLSGTGTVYLSNVFSFTGSNQFIEVTNGCGLEITSGGQIG